MSYPPHSAKVTLLTLLFLGGSGAARAQAAPPPAAPAPAPAAAQAAAPAVAPAPASFAMTNLRPALANVQTAITNLNVAHWKAPNDIRATTQQDINSMQRDLNTTLPGLLAQADTAAAASGPPALSPAFAVFRNLDALYDVMLRVTETAGLAGSASDASSLEDARAGLEDGRAKLGAWLLQAIGAQDAQVVRLQAPAAAHPAPAPPPPPNKIVVNDGPDATKPHKKKPPPTPAPQ
jgi:3-oxoacyl-ACP reductase-like protein